MLFKSNRENYTFLKKEYSRLKADTEIVKLQLGKMMAGQIRSGGLLSDISAAEFKVFSQWGDDGIIQYLIHQVEIPNETFIEFGVENYTEANTRFLLINNNWSGMIMDGSEKNMEAVRSSELYWKYDLKAIHAFITSENINDLISGSGFQKEVGLLHIDIDGNDYWVWKSVENIRPVIVIVEYNSLFGYEKPWTIPYQSDFARTKAHYSNLYYGASLLSLCDLAEEKGYSFIGCNSAGNNAYFVLKDRIGKLKALSPSEGYVSSKFREGRDQSGRLTFLSGDARLKQIKGLPVYNTRMLQTETIE